ncbi:MAG: hypothetical protein JJU20_09915 [Opitutales bacterium]|nr:hypothetical protein [Opitutales bacterium]
MFQIAWGFFVVTALLGFVLRLQLVHPLPVIQYGHVLHAHSHIAFLGWVFNAFFALSLKRFVRPEHFRFFIRWFIVLQVANLGMLIAYPMQGYGSISILFTTLHMVGSIAFALRLWNANTATAIARPFLKAALAFMLLSGIGPLALGPLAALDLRSSPLYELAIYWYLHFQYNGWFICFLLAWVFRQHPESSSHRAKAALRCWVSGIVLSFLLSVLWLQPPLWVFAIAGAGALVQLIGLGYSCAMLQGHWPRLAGGTKMIQTLCALAFAALVLKNLMQLAAAWPALADLANSRFIVIGFLHWVFLVVVTPFLIAEGLRLKWLPDNSLSRASIGLLILGVLLTQLILFAAPVTGTFGLPIPETNLVAAGMMLLGGIGVGFRRQ